MRYIENTGEDVSRLKKTVRKNVLAVRDAISAADKAKYDSIIKDIITEMEEYQQADAILAYVSYRSEADTWMLIEQALSDGKHVFAPKAAGNEMEFWRITTMEDLQEGYRGILEPVPRVSFPDWVKESSNIADTDTITDKDKTESCVLGVCKVMMWMPGAAFDRERHRIGYGGGFYDRYLNRLSCTHEKIASSEQKRLLIGHFTLTTAALAYRCQVLEGIPHEKHDRRPDFVITEQGILA